VTPIENLLAGVAKAGTNTGPDKITLRFIGAGALMLQTEYDRGTKDGDILKTEDLDASTRDHLLALAGPHTRVCAARASVLATAPAMARNPDHEREVRG